MIRNKFLKVARFGDWAYRKVNHQFCAARISGNDPRYNELVQKFQSASTSRGNMAATVTIDKAYFESLLRRYVQLSPYCQLWTNTW